MRRALSTVIILNFLVCSGCAVFNRSNTPALNLVEQYLVPKDKTAQALAYPLVVPVGLVATTLDMFLFHPLSVAEDAWDDTNELLWSNLDWDKRYVTTTVLNAPRVAVMPVVFTTDFLARSSFDISRRGGDILMNKNGTNQQKDDKLAEEKQKLAWARQALERRDLNEAIRLADEILAKNNAQREAAAIKAVVLLERRKQEAVTAMPPQLLLFHNALFVKSFAALLESGSSLERMQLLLLLDRHHASGVAGRNSASQAVLLAALEKNLACEDRAIRIKTVHALGTYFPADKRARLLLERVAQDNEPVLAAAARALLR